MDYVDSGVTGTYGAGQRVRERRTFEHARTRPTHPSRHGHAHTVDGGCARDHPPLHPRPCDANANDRDPRSRRPPHVRQPSRSPSKGRSQRHPKPILGRHLASARATEEQPAHGTEYGPPWVEMERPSQPNVAQVDGSRIAYSGAAAAPQGERGPRGSPVVRTREPRHLRLPNAPSTLNDGEKQWQQPCPDSKAGSPATHSQRGGHPRPPLHPHGRPETARAQSCPPTHMLPRDTREAVLGVVPARPYSVPVQRLGVATRRWLGSSTALCAKPST